MAAAVIAANNAANGNKSPFESTGPGNRSKFKSVQRSASGTLLEDLTVVLPARTFWVRDIELKKLSHKGKWELRQLVVAAGHVYISREGRVLEAIPLDQIRVVTAIHGKDSQAAGPLPSGGLSQRDDDGAHELVSNSQAALTTRQGGKRSRLIKMMSSSIAQDSSVHPDFEQVFEADTSAGSACFEIETLESGEYSGRSYIFASENFDERTDFISFLNELAAETAKRNRHKTLISLWQAKTRAVYESFIVQIFVALLIVAAFVIQVWESETFPEDGTFARSFIDTADVLLTFIFTIELGVNMFSNWFLPFVEDPWNHFDLVVVAVSIVSLVLSSVPGLGALRLMRTFRVLRLFGRLASFRRIVAALGAALLPVANAFIVVILMVSVFAIMGVFLFQNKAPQYFGSFSVSFFTMFTISTVDGWVDVVYVAAPDTLDVGKLYFIAYIIIVVWTLLPVVVAVLLDKFTEVMAKDKERLRRQRLPAFKPVTSSALDPILKTLTDFESDDNLSQRIHLLFETLDIEGRGSITHFGITEALRTLRMGTGMRVSEEDWEDLTQHGRLCDRFGGLDGDTFERIVRAELRDYLQRGLAGEILKCEEHSMSAPILSCLKLLLLRDPDALDPVSPASPVASALASLPRASRGQPRYAGAPAPNGPSSDRLVSARDRGSGGGVGAVEMRSVRSLPGVPVLGEEEDDSEPPTIPVEPVESVGAVSRSGWQGQGDGDVARSMQHMETLLASVLKGQQRLELKVDRLDGQVAALTDSTRQTAPTSSSAPLRSGETCDVCQDEPVHVRMGRASVCVLCSTLLTDGAV